MKYIFLVLLFLASFNSNGQIKKFDELLSLYKMPFDSVQNVLDTCWMGKFYLSFERINAYCDNSIEEQSLLIYKSSSSGISTITFTCFKESFDKIFNQFSEYGFIKVDPKFEKRHKYNTFYSGKDINVTVCKHPKIKKYSLLFHNDSGFGVFKLTREYVEYEKRKEKAKKNKSVKR